MRPGAIAEVAEALGTIALALTEGTAGAVYLTAGDGRTTCVWASHQSLREHGGTPGSSPVLVSDVRDLAPDDDLRRTADREGCRALASWPLTYAGKHIGSIVCGFAAPRHWSAAELDVMAALALQGGAAFDRASQGDGAKDTRIAEAFAILQTQSVELAEAHAALEAQQARLAQARHTLGAVNVWLLAVQDEFHAEQTRLTAEQLEMVKAREALAAEDARIAAARDALDAQIAAARQELEKEGARLAAVRQGLKELFESGVQRSEPRQDLPPTVMPEPQAVATSPPDTAPSEPPDRAPLSDAKRILEEESARLMQALAAEPQSTPQEEPLTVPAAGAVSAEPSEKAAPAEKPGGLPDPTQNGPAFELGGPLPASGALDELYPLLIERAAKLLKKERRSLAAEDQVKILGRALDDRDGHRAGYGERLEAWAEATAGIMGCSREEIADVRRAALLHDLGKIGVPEAILRAAARLSEQERRIVRSVPTLAEQVLRPVKGMQGVAAILRHRYEQWDGHGYPDGLRGDQIPKGARILAVVDAYGVMTTVRPYRAMVYSLDAVAELRRCAGVQFDPAVVEAFCGVLKREG
jgi:HD-GYP domain-containing protein (c-di-GMP phosphodiesterase class II)